MTEHPVFMLWEEPLYRLILQITILEVELLGLFVLGIIITREIRLVAEKRRKRFAKVLFQPLMNYLAGDLALEECLRVVKPVPRRYIAIELEKYGLMLEGGALSKIRALYESLNLRHLGLRMANSYFWWRRLEGVRLLGATGGDDVVDVLIEAVGDKNPVVRLAAVRSLGRIRHARSIRPLLDMLSASEQMSRRQLAQALISFGSDVHPFLRRMLEEGAGKSRDVHFLSTVIEVLALTGDVNAAKPIRNALKSPYMELRIAAFKAVALLHIPLNTKELKRGLLDDEWPVRAQAALVAGTLRDKAVIGTLGDCLSDRAWWVRSNAGTALFSYGRAGVALLERIANSSEDRFARDMALRTLTSDPLYNAFENRHSLPVRMPAEG